MNIKKIKLKHKINSALKRTINSILLGRGKLITSSDYNRFGLHPYAVEFLMLQASNILHVGAHYGEEASYYERLGKDVIWVEANPEHIDVLLSKISRYRNQTARQALLGSQCNNFTQFHVASNEGHSSGLYPLSGNSFWGDLYNSKIIEMPSQRFDCLFSESDLANRNYWLLDVQGGELDVINGIGKLASFCKYLHIEVSLESFYVGGAQYYAIKEMLSNIGFYPIWEPIFEHEEIIFLNSNYSS